MEYIQKNYGKLLHSSTLAAKGMSKISNALDDYDSEDSGPSEKKNPSNKELSDSDEYGSEDS